MKKRKYPELTALKGKLREEKKTYRELSKEVNISLNALNDKLNGYSVLNIDEVNQIVEALGIEKEEMLRYFFPHMLRNAIKDEQAATKEVC